MDKALLTMIAIILNCYLTMIAEYDSYHKGQSPLNCSDPF